jgi:transmembrane sensor
MSTLNMAVVEQAIAWRVRLASGTCALDELNACQSWRAQHPDNELAWQRLDALGGRFAAITPGIGHATLTGARHDPQRRRALKALAILVAAGGTGVIATHSGSIQPWVADVRTGVGERRKVTLPDGGSLHLNASTAVDIQYSSEQRLVRLLQGEIFVETAADPQRRLFWVDTAQGRLRALGTRFLVREQGQLCDLAVYAGAVEVHPGNGGTASVVNQGWQTRFGVDGVMPAQPAQNERNSWIDGVLVAREMRLGDFTAELNRQRHGVLRCDPAVAELRISGVFPLDEGERALQAVARTLPVQVVYRTRWWVTLMPA